MDRRGLGCQGLRSTGHEGARPVLHRLFHAYGLPTIIRSDNGVPFATTAIGRLSRLSIWWIRLGIYPELIEPGPSRAERPARADAQDAQTRNDASPGRDPARAATTLRSIPRRVQHRASPRGTRPGDAGFALHAVVAIPLSPAAAHRIPRALRNAAHESQRGVPLGQSPSAPVDSSTHAKPGRTKSFNRDNPG